MKKTKLYLGAISMFIITLVLTLNLAKPRVEAAQEESASTPSEIVAKYYNDGVYTKKTQIHLNELSKSEIALHFHGELQEDRTTYYNGEFLLMGDLDGGFDEINSGYRTNDNGTLNHFRVDKTQLVEHKLDITNTAVYSKDSYAAGKSLHDFYVTLDKISAEGYFDGWTSNSYDVTGNDDPYLLDFLAFVAPCLEDTILDTKYITSSSMTLTVSEECNAYLSLKMYVDATNSGTVDNEELLLAEARVYRGNKQFAEYTYTINHLDANTLEAVAPAKEVVLGYNDLFEYDGYYTYDAPTVEGMVPSHDYINFVVDGENLTSNIYYSEMDTLTAETVASESLVGSGTEEDPYLISSASDFLYFQANAASVKGIVKMTKSINLDVENFKIVGKFAGTLDGNNCSIRGINIIGTAAQTGLFDTVTGTIKNLSIYGKVTQTANVNYTAALVGLLNSGHLYNIANYCDVEGVARTGGIVGWHKNGGSSINNCVNYGNISGSGARIGGIIGHSSESPAIYVNNCVNYGEIRGTSNVGGLNGYCQNSSQTYNGCVNYGKVIASTNYGGGITGYCSVKLITNCINYGEIVSPTSGAIVGHCNATSAVIENCVNYGVLSKVGSEPMIGKMDKIPTITNCVNYYEPTEE